MFSFSGWGPLPDFLRPQFPTDSCTTSPKESIQDNEEKYDPIDNPSAFFNDSLRKHVAICPDVVLEQTIIIWHVLRHHPPTNEQLWVYTMLDEVLPLRPLTCPKLEHGQSHPVVRWSDFVALNSPKPLELLLMQPECSQLPTAKELFELHQHALKLGEGFTVTLDGTPINAQPFNGLKKQVDKITTLIRRLFEAEYDEKTKIIQSLQTICDHYTNFAKLVCDHGRASPTHYSFDDLWAKEEFLQADGSCRYLGGNATLGGIDVGYFRVSQAMVGKLTQQDDWGLQPEVTSSGSHPTFTNNEMPLFFKATTFGKEDTLGTTKEHAMYVLAEKLFQRGVAPTALITINRHVTIDLVQSKREHPLFNLTLFQQRSDMFQNHDDLIAEYSLEYPVVKHEQAMDIPRLVQVAEKVMGKELGVDLNSTPDTLDKKSLSDMVLDSTPTTLDKKSLSETVLFTLLTCANDAKGDNFVVREDGVIIGIDNDHVLGLPTTTSRDGFTVVNLKNVLLCDPAILATPVHPDVVSLLDTFEFDAMLVEWLSDMASYEEKVDRLRVQGALPQTWVSTNFGHDDSANFGHDADYGATGRMSRYWCVLKTLVTTKKEDVTHGDLFLALFPSVATFYSLVADHVALNTPAKSDPNTIRREVMRYLYYQGEMIAPKQQQKRSALYMMEELAEHNYVSPTDDLSFELPTSTPSVSENVCGSQLMQLLQAVHLSRPPSFRTLINALSHLNPGVFGLREWTDALPEGWKSKNILSILIHSGETNVAILNTVFQFSHQDLSTEVLVDGAIQRILSTPSLATHGETFDEQCRWLKEKNLFLDTATKRDSLLCKVVVKYLRKDSEELFELLGLFVILVKYGARKLSSNNSIMKFSKQLGSIVANSHHDSARVAIATLAQTNLRLQWQLLLSELIFQTESASSSDIQCSELGLCNIAPTILRDHLLNSTGEVIQPNRFGCRKVGRIQSQSFGDVYVKVSPELPGVEFMVRELHRTLFGRDAAPYTELVRWNRNDTADIAFNAPVLFSQGVDGNSLHEVLAESNDHGAHVLENLEPRSLSRMIFMAILTMPEDGKPDNYICKLGASELYELVCIDNDHAFAPPSAKDTNNKRHLHLKVKCVLFCLNQMKNEIDPKIQQEICDPKFNVIERVGTWLHSLEKRSEQTEALFHNIKHTTTDSALGIPIPAGATRLLCEKLHKAREFLGKNPKATHLELLRELEPLLARRYRDALDRTDHVWARFKDVDGEGFLLVDGCYTSMFNTLQTLESRLGCGVNLKTMQRVQDGLEMSPKQALNELCKVEEDWSDLSKNTLLHMKGIVPETHVEEILSLTSVPINVVERVLDECDFSEVGVRVQRNFLQLLAKRQEHICKLVLCGFEVSIRTTLLSLVGHNLTKLKLVNCSGVDVGGDSRFSSSALTTIAITCDALESLEIVGNETLSKIGSRTTPLRFSSLIVLRVERCPVLSCIGVAFDRENGSGGKLFISECPTLAWVAACGKISSRSWRWNGKESPESEVAFIKLMVPAKHCASFVPTRSALVPRSALEFHGNTINSEDIEWIMRALSYATWIVEFNLFDNVGDEGARKIAEALKTNTTLMRLNLHCKCVGDKGADKIAEALKTNTTLTRLSLYSTLDGVEGVSKIAEALKTNTTLTTLNLGFNNVGVEGVSKIAEVLKTNTTLTTLNLCYTTVGDEGAIKIAEGLKKNTTLTELDLRFNNVGVEGAGRIAEALKTNMTLKTLKLDRNNIGDEGASKIAEALKTNTTLTTLYLWYTNVGVEWASMIAEALKINTTLKTLGFDKKNISDEWKALLKNVWNNRPDPKGDLQLL